MRLLRAAYANLGEPVVVEASPCFGPVLAAIFPDYQVRAPTGPVDFELREDDSGGARVSDRAGVRLYPSAAEALADFELGLAQVLADRFVLPLLHASGVTTKGGALLLPGDSGSGKSSLAVGLSLGGFPVLGDDAIALDATLPGVRPFKRLLKIHPGAEQALGVDGGDPRLKRYWPDASFYRPEALGSKWASAAPVEFVVFPLRTVGAAAELRPEGSGAGVRGLMELVLQGGGSPAEMFDTLARITERARFFRLAFDDSRAAVRHIERALGLRTEAVE